LAARASRRKRFGGLQPKDIRHLKQHEAENARLKKLVAERDLEIELMKGKRPLMAALFSAECAPSAMLIVTIGIAR
jgi:hypothetical protein